MPRYALRLEYHGAPFQGWQRQTTGASVQAAVEGAFARLAEGVAVTAAGRTDAGVHAQGQVIHADLPRPWDPFRLSEALNHHLRPEPVAVTACAQVPDDFHARFSARARHYRYRIQCRRAPPVLAGKLVWHLRHPLDVTAMRAGAQHLLGKHDFTTFRATLCQAKSPIKTLDRLDVSAFDIPGGAEVWFDLSARSFLHNQVRSIVGTLERVGAGAWHPDRVAQALAAQNRAACGPVAPPDGLSLMAVDYDPDPFGG